MGRMLGFRVVGRKIENVPDVVGLGEIQRLQNGTYLSNQGSYRSCCG